MKLATTACALALALAAACAGNGGGDDWTAYQPDFGTDPGAGGADADAAGPDARDVGGAADPSPWTTADAPDFGGTGPTGGKLTAALQAATSCDDITAQWKQAAIDDMASQLMAEWWAVVHYSYPCPEPVEDYGYYTQDCVAGESVASTDSGGGGASEYSTTNVQVVGVDEADFLKNDGKWVQVLANGNLQVVDAWPPEQAHRVSSTHIEGDPLAMFVEQDVAVIYSSLGGYGYPQKACTYGYDCEFTGDGNDTKITVLDLADRAHPKLMREVRINGSYLAARRIGSYVYTVVYFRDPNIVPPGLITVVPPMVGEAMAMATCGQPLALDPAATKAAFEQLFDENRKKIEALSIDAWTPTVTDKWYVGDQGTLQGNPLTDCQGYMLAGTGDGMALTSLISFDLKTGSKLNATTIRSRPGAVFASDQALYLAMRHQWGYGGEWFEGMSGVTEATTVHKFTLSQDAPTTTYQASGLVKGRVLNQFSMGEQNGRLQMATTTGTLPGPAYNTVMVLEPKDDQLQVVGMLDHLAENEDIRSVRFGGDLAFIVTFKKTDPLFVIDLSDPTQPNVKGELQIPGFSTYLHFLDATHLLSIGFDAQDMGSYAWFQGVMLQVFDVTDITAPKLLHKEVIGTRGSASDAATDHLAFNFFPPKDLLAIPMVVCEGGQGRSDYGDLMTFNGLMVYKVTVADGFQYQGGIPHPTSQAFGYGGGCGQWWADSSSTVKRSIFLDDYAVSVAFDRIEFSKLADLANPVASIDLTLP